MKKLILPIITFFTLALNNLSATIRYINDATFNTTDWCSAAGNDITGTGSTLKPYATLSKALSVAIAGDTIRVDVGLYTNQSAMTASVSAVTIEGYSLSASVFQLTSGTNNFLTINANSIAVKNLTIKGYNSNTALQGKAITITDVIDIDINNILFDGCLSASGGEPPIYISTNSNKNTSATISKCAFMNNIGNYGGAIDVAANTNNGTVTNQVIIDSCYFENNGKYLNNGGAINIYNGLSSGGSTKAPIVSIKNSVFGNSCVGNQAMRGGAIYIDNGAGVTISNCCLQNNQSIDVAGPDGGGALWIGAAQVTVKDSKFENNTANTGTPKYGGGIYVSSGFGSTNLLVNRCAFIGNIANRGAGIYAGKVTMNLFNSLFYSNTATGASSFGGGLAVNNASANVAMYNCTFSKNTTTAASRGNGIDANSGNFTTFDIKNSIIYGNGAGKEIAGGTSINVSWSIVGTGSTAGTDYTSITGNSTANPLFTNSTGNDFTLSGTSSPAYNTGNSDGGSAPTDDINAITRPQFDMGCYALNSTPILKWTCPNYVNIGSISAANTSICPGQSLTLTASPSTGYTYFWSSIPSGFSATTATVSVSPTVTTVYQVQINNATPSCGSYGTATFTVSMGAGPQPVVKPDFASICSGNVMGITGGGTSTYTWTVSQGTISATTGTIISYTAPTVSVSTTATISCVGTSSLGCVSAAPSTTVITINPIPVIAVSANDTSICSAASATVNASGADTYTWTTTSGTLSATNGNQVVLTAPTVTTITTVTVSINGISIDGCPTTSPGVLTFTVNPIPVSNITAASTTICGGTSTTYTASGASTYTWTASTGTVSPTNGNIVTYQAPTFSTATTVTLTANGSSAAGCLNAAPADIVLTVDPLPQVSAVATSTTLCGGSTTFLTGSGASTYTWNVSSGTLNSPNGNTVIYTAPSLTTSSTVTVTLNGSSAAGCLSSNTFTMSLNINPVPQVIASANDSSLCSAGTASLTASGANSFTWTATNGNISPLVGSAATYTAPAVSVVTTITVTAIGTNTLGCNSVPASITFTLNPIPVVTASASSALVCSGTTTTLTANGASTYTWTAGSGTFSSPNTNPVVYTAPLTTISTTITVIINGTSAAGCSNSTPGTISIAVEPAPNVQINTTTSTICTGDVVSLNASGANSYTWTATSGNLSSNTGTPVTFTPPTSSVVTTSTISLTGTNSFGCTNTVPYTTVITTNPVTTPTVTLSGSPGICAGTSLVLTSNPSTGIVWNTGMSTPSITVTGSGSYSVTAVNNFGCEGTSSVITTTLFPASPAPAITNSGQNMFCQGDSVKLSINQTNGVTWLPGGQTTNTIYVNTSGTYTVTYTDANNCPTTPAHITIQVNNNPIINYGSLLVTPAHCNKNDGAINGLNVTSGTGPFTYTWYDTTHTVIQSGSATLNPIGPGTYSLVVTDFYGCKANGVSEIVPNLPGIQVVLTATPQSGFAPLTVSYNAQISNANINGGYTWNYGNGILVGTVSNVSQHIYTSSGIYNTIVMVTDSFGCVASDTVQILVDELVSITVPNIFTPNDDGTNDVFSILSSGIKDMNISIYNRWGEIMTEQSGLTIGWDGTTKNGHKASDGTYYYILNYTTDHGITKNTEGFITLTR